MGLELVAGGQGRGEANPGRGDEVSRAVRGALEEIAAAERALAGVRERLQVLIERAAELRRRLGPNADAGPRDESPRG